MSIEKMLMLNMVGHISDLDSICKSVVSAGCLHPVSAIHQIDTSDFTLSTTEDNLEALIDVCSIRPYTSDREYSIINRKITKLKELCSISKGSRVLPGDLIYDYKEIENSTAELIDLFQDTYNELEHKKREEAEIAGFIKHLEFLKGLNVSLYEVQNLKNFSFDIFKLTRENVIKLKHNYENVPSIVKSVYKGTEYVIVICFTPNVFKAESDRIFKSLNAESIALPVNCDGTPDEIITALSQRLREIRNEKINLEKELEKLSKENGDKVNLLEKSFEFEMKSAEIKNNIACTNGFFYLCGWVPQGELKKLKSAVELYSEKLIIIEKNTEEITGDITPPTKLKNNLFIKPFESMVGMYGMPAYGELDPTGFLGISYIIMFGAMFGDVGQGLVFLLAGLFMQHKKHSDTIGGVLVRLGIGSTIFGWFYGSIFGFEHVIKPLIISPMEDIMSILIYAIIFGCGLLIVGFVYSILNSIKQKNIENGVFGKDGVVGLVFFLCIVVMALTIYMEIEIMPIGFWIFIFAVLLVIMLLKEPLAHLVQNKRPLYSESKSEYFIEGGFGVIETLLSTFSNTLSFIRVGAFALNHTGLFLAFSALANMMHNSAGSIFMYVLGNVIIIGLEGLIVFIQGLRLEYYELFGKYYDGSGVPFEPVRFDM